MFTREDSRDMIISLAYSAELILALDLVKYVISSRVNQMSNIESIRYIGITIMLEIVLVHTTRTLYTLLTSIVNKIDLEIAMNDDIILSRSIIAYSSFRAFCTVGELWELDYKLALLLAFIGFTQEVYTRYLYTKYLKNLKDEIID